MTHRMVVAVLALTGALISLYLWLWKVGAVGSLACGSGACGVVQSSRYAEILGLPVALVGVLGYLALLGVSLLGVQPRFAGRPGPTIVLVVLSGIGVAFTAYLTFLEAVVIRAWCRWCVFSAVLISSIFVTALVGLRARAPRTSA